MNWLSQFLARHTYLMSAEGEGGDAPGGGDGGNKGGEGSSTPSKDTPGITPEMITNLTAGIGKLNQIAERLAEQAAQNNQQSMPDNGDDGDGEGEGDLEDPLAAQDLDIVPRREFANRLQKSFERNLVKHLKPLQDAVGKANNTAATVAVRTEVEKFAARTPDFYEWTKQMQDLTKVHPSLGVRDLYTLARSGDPDRAKELDKKAEESRKVEAEGDTRQRRRGFGGLAPSGSQGAQRPAKMTPDAAAAAAWEETIQEFGGAPFQLED